MVFLEIAHGVGGGVIPAAIGFTLVIALTRERRLDFGDAFTAGAHWAAVAIAAVPTAMAIVAAGDFTVARLRSDAALNHTLLRSRSLLYHRSRGGRIRQRQRSRRGQQRHSHERE